MMDSLATKMKKEILRLLRYHSSILNEFLQEETPSEKKLSIKLAQLNVLKRVIDKNLKEKATKK